MLVISPTTTTQLYLPSTLPAGGFSTPEKYLFQEICNFICLFSEWKSSADAAHAQRREMKG